MEFLKFKYTRKKLYKKAIYIIKFYGLDKETAIKKGLLKRSQLLRYKAAKRRRILKPTK